MVEYVKKLELGKLIISIHYRSRSKNVLGRFGGGWNWELGIQAGGHTIILNCLVFYIRFDFKN